MSENATPVAPVQNIVHTPGPWETTGVSKWSDGVNRCCVGPARGGYAIANICNVDADMGVADANARLIAAAPELAEALRILYDFQNGPPLEKYRDQWNDAMALAKAAMAKAGNL